MVHIGSIAVVCYNTGGGIAVVVAGVELKAINTVLGLRLTKHANEVLGRLRVSQVVARAIAVPPVEDSYPVVSTAEQIAFGCQFAVLG